MSRICPFLNYNCNQMMTIPPELWIYLLKIIIDLILTLTFTINQQCYPFLYAYFINISLKIEWHETNERLKMF